MQGIYINNDVKSINNRASITANSCRDRQWQNIPKINILIVVFDTLKANIN